MNPRDPTWTWVKQERKCYEFMWARSRVEPNLGEVLLRKRVLRTLIQLTSCYIYCANTCITKAYGFIGCLLPYRKSFCLLHDSDIICFAIFRAFHLSKLTFQSSWLIWTRHEHHEARMGIAQGHVPLPNVPLPKPHVTSLTPMCLRQAQMCLRQTRKSDGARK